MRYSDEKEIYDLVRGFENASIPRENWKHADHLIVGLHYLSKHDLETATEKMRDGIFKLLRDGFCLDLEKEMPYHETLTIFWMKTISEFNAAKSDLPLAEKANALVEIYDKDYPLRFYSRKLLFSDAARARYIEGDL